MNKGFLNEYKDLALNFFFIVVMYIFGSWANKFADPCSIRNYPCGITSSRILLTGFVSILLTRFLISDPVASSALVSFLLLRTFD
jgi:hypothetical protein